MPSDLLVIVVVVEIPDPVRLILESGLIWLNSEQRLRQLGPTIATARAAAETVCLNDV